MLPVLLASLLTAPPAPQYEVDVPLDLSLTLGSLGTLFLLHEFAGPALPRNYVCSPAAPLEPCDADHLSWLDRGTVGNRSRAWVRASDWALGGVLGLAAGATILEHTLAEGPTEWSTLGADAIIIAESVAFASVAAHTLRYAVRRPRPTQYVLGTPVEPAERHLSFPSAHATSASAAATSYAVTYWLRHADSASRWLIASAATLGTAFVAFGRVQAGRHFPSDVLGGVLVGATAGIAVPLLHVADVQVVVSGGESKTVALAGRW